MKLIANNKYSVQSCGGGAVAVCSDGAVNASLCIGSWCCWQVPDAQTMLEDCRQCEYWLVSEQEGAASSIEPCNDLTRYRAEESVCGHAR